jgi:CRP-like cAMP-binding protein
MIHGNAVETLGPGGLIGEMALLDHTFRSASAVAKIDCALVPLNEKKFLNHVNRTPMFALQVMRVIADRLRQMNTSCIP